MSRSLTKFFAFMLVAGFALSAFAQDESNIIRPITKSGSAAFVFNVSGLGAFGPAAPGIGTANGNLISGAGIKYYLSDDLAAKILLAFGTTDNGVEKDKGTNVSTTQLGLGAIIEVHFGPLYSTSPYAGGGIHFASGSSTRARRSVVQPLRASQAVRRSPSWVLQALTGSLPEALRSVLNGDLATR